MAETIISKYGIAADAVLIAAFFGNLAITMDMGFTAQVIMAAMGVVSVVQMADVLRGN